MKRYLSVTLVAVAATGFCKEPTPWTHLDFQQDEGDFQFAIIPDRAGGDFNGAFTNALEKVNLFHPAFVMSVGDLISHCRSDDKSVRARHAELTNMVRRVEAPFFHVIGNHDITLNGLGTEYTNEHSTELWKEFFGPQTYYSFVYKDCLFVCLNSMDRTEPRKTGLSPKQFAWFRKTLDEHRDVRWTFVFMHMPSHWYGADWMDFEKEVLTKRPYTVFAGDWHAYLHCRRYGRDYYILSVAGGCSDHRYMSEGEVSGDLMGADWGEMNHITLVSMTKTGPRVVNVTLDGILPGDYLDQTNSKRWWDVSDLNIPRRPEAEARLQANRQHLKDRAERQKQRK